MRLVSNRPLAAFRWKLGVAVALVALGDFMFFQRELYGGHFGFYGFALLVGLTIGRADVRHDRRAWFAAALAGLFAVAAIYDFSLLSWLLFWIATGMATLFPKTAAFDDGWRWFQRGVAHGYRSLVSPALDLYRLMRVRRYAPAGPRGLRARLPVLMLPLIGSAVIVTLFSYANPLIADALSRLGTIDPNAISFARLFLWLLLFAMAWSLLRPRVFRYLLPTFDGRGDLPLAGVSVASVTLSLILFNLLFAVQNLLDIGYLWGFATLPDGMTLAEYAHRGAYPLIATALLAGLFVLVTLRPGSSTAAVPAIRRMVVLWIAQNVFLVASSILRTIDYVEVYSLTQLRIAALAWMVLVAVGLLLICWRMLRGKSASWLINTNLAAAGLLLTAACFIDTGAVAARWNIAHAREIDGNGVRLDLCYLGELGGSSLLSLVDLEQQKLTPDLADRVRAVRLGVQQRLADDMPNGWTWLGAQRLAEARRIMDTPAERTRPAGERDCNGAIILPPPSVEPGAGPVIANDPDALTAEAQR